MRKIKKVVRTNTLPAFFIKNVRLNSSSLTKSLSKSNTSGIQLGAVHVLAPQLLPF